jgi:hypothetical protein
MIMIRIYGVPRLRAETRLLHVEASAVGQRLASWATPGSGRISPAAGPDSRGICWRASTASVLFPDPETSLTEGDVLLLLGRREVDRVLPAYHGRYLRIDPGWAVLHASHLNRRVRALGGVGLGVCLRTRRERASTPWAPDGARARLEPRWAAPDHVRQVRGRFSAR